MWSLCSNRPIWVRSSPRSRLRLHAMGRAIAATLAREHPSNLDLKERCARPAPVEDGSLARRTPWISSGANGGGNFVRRPNGLIGGERVSSRPPEAPDDDAYSVGLLMGRGGIERTPSHLVAHRDHRRVGQRPALPVGPVDDEGMPRDEPGEG